MSKMKFDSFDDAERYLSDHVRECEYREVKSQCQHIVEFPCKSCGTVLTKVGVATLARGGGYCVTCGAVLMADRDRGDQERRFEMARRHGV